MATETSAQSNYGERGSLSGLPRRFWALLFISAVGAGLAAGLLLRLLFLVERASYGRGAAGFIAAVRQASPERLVLVLLCAGAIAGVVSWLLRQGPGGHGGEVSEAIWFEAGRMPVLGTSVKALLSIVIVGMGASLGRGWAVFWPGGASGSYAVVGAMAMLAATTQAPVSSIVLVMELTHRLDPLMVPVLLAAGVATFVSRRIDPRSIYSARVRQGRAAANPSAGEVSAADHYSEVMRKLAEWPGEAPLHVVDAAGRRVGEINRAGAAEAGRKPSPHETLTAGDMADNGDRGLGA